jgi:hypothetical protein
MLEKIEDDALQKSLASIILNFQGIYFSRRSIFQGFTSPRALLHPEHYGIRSFDYLSDSSFYNIFTSRYFEILFYLLEAISYLEFLSEFLSG